MIPLGQGYQDVVFLCFFSLSKHLLKAWRWESGNGKKDWLEFRWLCWGGG